MSERVKLTKEEWDILRAMLGRDEVSHWEADLFRAGVAAGLERTGQPTAWIRPQLVVDGKVIHGAEVCPDPAFTDDIPLYVAAV